MPEAPEVRIYADKLRTLTEINSIEIFNEKFRETLQKVSLPQKILKIKTKGKFLYIILEKVIIGFNFSLSGKFLNTLQGENPFFSFNNTIYYSDKIGFSKIEILDSKSLKNKLNKIGKCILYIYKNELSNFVEKLRKKFKKPIQVCKVLLDQSIIGGIGNYIKCDALYKSKIHPTVLLGELSDNEVINLLWNCVKISRKSYHAGGRYAEGGDFGEIYHPLIYEKKFVNGEEVLIGKFSDGRKTYYIKNDL